jgi:hypothetical protein
LVNKESVNSWSGKRISGILPYGVELVVDYDGAVLNLLYLSEVYSIFYDESALYSYKAFVTNSIGFLHLKQLAIDAMQLAASDESVDHGSYRDNDRANDVGLSMRSAGSESLPPTSFHLALLLALGVIVMGVSGFVGLCIFIFKGPLRDGIIAAVLFVAGSILFFYGVNR